MGHQEIQPINRAAEATEKLRRSRAKVLRQSTPEWVMLGLKWPGPGVLLLASRTLTAAELDFRARLYEFDSWEQFAAGFRPELTLSVHMRSDYVVVAGPDYAACLAELLTNWSPDDRAAVPSALTAS